MKFQNLVLTRILPLALGSVAAVLSGTTPAHALTISFLDTANGIYSTGLNSDGSPASSGNTDAHWTIISVPSGALGTSGIPSSTPYSAFDFGSVGGSGPIGPAPSSTANVSVGNYEYQTTFSLAGLLPNTAQITFSGGVDDSLYEVILNGTSVSFNPSSVGAIPSNTITSGFQSGTNTLDLIVTNAGTNPNPTALNLDITSATAQAVPFDVPGGATIPAVGSLLALGALRKVRNFKKA